MLENILVIVVDGLRASALGAYGNTSYATPTLDRLATQSLLLEWCFAPAPGLADIYRASWRSEELGRSSADIALPRFLANAGYQTTIVTDEPSLSAFSSAEEFDEIIQVGSSTGINAAKRRATHASSTDLAHTFTAAIELVSETQRSQPRLVWLHTRGMYGPWDAPLEFQSLLLDEDDPEPIDSAAPPDKTVGVNEPDAAFRHACAYAAQVMVLDECLEGLLNAAGANNNSRWLISLMGARGFPLGEHGRIGGVDPRTYVEQMQVPWLISFPGGLGSMTRADALTSHRDLMPTLIDWIDRDQKLARSGLQGASVLPWTKSYRPAWREAVISKSETARSIRTASWCLREGRTQPTLEACIDATDAAELYVRPDDRWEANDVAKLCPDEVEKLRAGFSIC